jgi:hypothetical protein
MFRVAVLAGAVLIASASGPPVRAQDRVSPAEARAAEEEDRLACLFALTGPPECRPADRSGMPTGTVLHPDSTGLSRSSD